MHTNIKLKSKKEKRKRSDVYSTRYSQAVTHPSTNRAQRGSDENRCFQRGMAVDDNRRKMTRNKPNVNGKVVNNHYGGFMREFSLKTF